jgi:hypothetical protein
VAWFAADASLGYDNLNQNGRGFDNRGFRTTGPNPSPQNNGRCRTTRAARSR